MGRRSDHTAEELRRMTLDAARKIVSENGLRGLTTRSIAREIGYTVGTLYQIFDNVDRLIEQMNIETLDAMRSHYQQIDFKDGPGEGLRALVHRYLEFTNDNRELWSAVIDHNLPEDFQRQDRYFEAVGGLLNVVEQAIAPLYQPGDEEDRLRDANLLWASLYGITALASADRLARSETVLSLSDTLIDTYLKARV